MYYTIIVIDRENVLTELSTKTLSNHDPIGTSLSDMGTVKMKSDRMMCCAYLACCGCTLGCSPCLITATICGSGSTDCWCPERKNIENRIEAEKLMVVTAEQGENRFIKDSDQKILCTPEWLKHIDYDAFPDGFLALVEEKSATFSPFDPTKPHHLVAYVNDKPSEQGNELLTEYGKLLEKKAQDAEIAERRKRTSERYGKPDRQTQNIFDTKNGITSNLITAENDSPPLQGNMNRV